MKRMLSLPLKQSAFLTAAFILLLFTTASAQSPISTQSQNGLLRHGIEQYRQGHYNLAHVTLSEYLEKTPGRTATQATGAPAQEREEAVYYLVLSGIRQNQAEYIPPAEAFIAETANPVYRQRAAFLLAQSFFKKNNLDAAIKYYEIAGIANLNNEEIGDEKFELAYSYFNQQKFEQAKPLFAAIKDLPQNKYYIPGNYYYGLLAYNDKNYADALKSFERIHNEPSYKDVVPYYEAEIHYFMGDQGKVLQIARKYLRKDSLYYSKDMELLTAQTLFEQKKFAEALPYFEHYYEHSDKIRKEELYELAYSYYRLEKWPEAIETFQPLSNAQDSLGQTSMYLLGDCYLKMNDKKGARNAFGICADMNYNPSQQEAASFLYAKLSDELGNEGIATKKFYDFLQKYPQSHFANEAKTLLTALLAKSSNYAEAFNIMSDMAVKDNATWAIYQQVAVGRAMQLLQNKHAAEADSVLNLSLQQPADPDYEAIAYFWKGEIAYTEKRYPQAVQFSQTFLDKAQGREAGIQRISNVATAQNAELNIGYAQLASQHYEDAQRAFTRAQVSTVSGFSAVLSADAILREADARFMQKDYDKAATLYDNAIAAGVSDPDYARFQKSIIYGLQGKTDEKRTVLNDLISKKPESTYKNDALYELAQTDLSTGNAGNAAASLKTLATDPATPGNIRAKALLKLAYAYQQDSRNEEAMETYKQYLNAYPAAADRDDALDALRSLYVTAGTPEKYADYLRENNFPSADDTTIESTFYDAATQDYGASRWEQAARGFSKYLERFPNGTFATKARFYRATSYFEMKDYEKALSDYEAVVSGGWSEFSEEAAAKAAHISFEQKDYERAEESYQHLRNVAVNDNNLQIAYEGLMKTSFALENYQDAAAYADTLTSLPGLDRNIQTQAQLFKAKALQKDNHPDEAKALYTALDKDNLGAASAEARYRIAEILFGQHQLKEAETQAGYAAQASGGQDYWVVKCYILLADILTEEKDYFNAKATLQSVVKNTDIPELKEAASVKLQKVKALEKEKSKLSED